MGGTGLPVLEQGEGPKRESLVRFLLMDIEALDGMVIRGGSWVGFVSLRM